MRGLTPAVERLAIGGIGEIVLARQIVDERRLERDERIGAAFVRHAFEIGDGASVSPCPAAPRHRAATVSVR